MEYISNVFFITLSQLSLFLLPSIIMTMAMHFIASTTEKRSILLFKEKLFLCLFGWLGVAIHECGHAVFCLIFRHKIIEMKLFSPNKETGTLGYVRHSYNKNNIYHQIGNFFIGIGPILLGGVIISLLSYILLPGNTLLRLQEVCGASNLAGVIDTFSNFVKEFYSQLTSPDYPIWKLCLFLYLSFAIGSNMTLSWADIKSALSGCVIMVVFWFLINLSFQWTGYTANISETIMKYLMIFYLILGFAMLINLILLIPIYILSSKK